MPETNKDRFSFWVESFTSQIGAWNNIKEESSTEEGRQAAMHMIEAYTEAIDFLNAHAIGKNERTQVEQVFAFCESHKGLCLPGILRNLQETAWDIQLQHTNGVSGPDAVWRD